MRPFVIALAIAVASCSSSPKVDVAPLVAKVMWGLADGGEMMIFGIGKGRIALRDEGIFEIDFNLVKGTVSFAEDEPCNVGTRLQLGSNPSVEGHYDLTKLTGIAVREADKSAADLGRQAGLNVIEVLLEGAGVTEGQVAAPFGAPGYAFLFTSLTVAEVQAAADELQRIC